MRKYLRAAALSAGLVTVFATFVAGSTPALAAGATSVQCNVNATVALIPGITMTPSTGRFKSTAGSTITCNGTFKGHAIQGAADLFKLHGVYGTGATGDTCQSGAGSGVAVIGYKINGTLIKQRASFTFTRAGSAVQVSGTIGGATITGALGFVPTTGDCATTPVTAANVAGPLSAQ
jgi:hypothetical protein